MSELQIELTVNVTDADVDQIDHVTRNLMRDLRDLGAESVKQTPGEEIPEGAKALESILVGGLTLSALPELLPKLVEFLQTWVQRPDTRTVKIKAPNGTEVEFTPKHRLTPGEVVELVKKLNTPQILRP